MVAPAGTGRAPGGMTTTGGAEDALLAALASAGVRLTEPRRALAGLIDGRPGHFTAADLLADVARHRIPAGRATVFRALELLTGLGLVERLELPGGDHAYVRCDPVHHHHVVCRGCGASTEIEDRGLPDVVRDAARRTGYRIDGHRLELYGRCPACVAGEAR